MSDIFDRILTAGRVTLFIVVFVAMSALPLVATVAVVVWTLRAMGVIP